MKTIFLAIILFCSSCAHKNQVSIDYRLQPYVDSFISDAASLGVIININNLILRIGYLDKNLVGLCEYTKTPIITINESYHQYYVSQELFYDIEQVVYHELGHCVLGLKHNDTVNSPEGYPVSIMNTYHFSGNLYQMFKHNYIREMFLGIPNEFN
jgi:hypothetical protein